MVQRGRKSLASLLETPLTDIAPRPQPPAELDDEEAVEWVEICGSLPADYFSRPTQSTLASYCRHVCIARHLAERIRRCCKNKFDAELRLLLREHRQETAAIDAHLRAMRLTHLAVKPSARTRIPSNPLPRPWEG